MEIHTKVHVIESLFDYNMSMQNCFEWKNWQNNSRVIVS